MVIDDLEPSSYEDSIQNIIGGEAIATGNYLLGYGYSFAGAYAAATGNISSTYTKTSASSFLGQNQVSGSVFIHAKAYESNNFGSDYAVYHASAHFHSFSGSSMTLGGSVSSSYHRSLPIV